MVSPNKKKRSHRKPQHRVRIQRDKGTLEALLAARKCLSSEDHEGCVRICRAILERTAQEPEALHLLGLSAFANGQYPAAIELIGQAIGGDDTRPGYFNSLGVALLKTKRLADAAQSFRQAIRLNPNLETAHYNLGTVHLEGGAPAEAEKCFRNALRIRPAYSEARNSLGAALLSLGQPGRAVPCFEKVLEKQPSRPDTWCNLGVAKMSLGLRDDAQRCLEKAVRLNPDSAPTHHHLGYFYKREWDLGKAAAHYETAVRLGGGEDALNNLGNIRNDQGRHRQAREIFAKLCATRPTPKHEHVSNLLLVLNYFSDLQPREVFGLHVHWGGVLSQATDKLPPARPAPVSLTAPLKIGYVSRDFREHSVACFMESVLAHHDPGRVAVHCYADAESGDAVTGRLQACVPHWRDIHGITHRQVAERIRADGIHILVDLAGHTGKNRLPVFAARPAPLQATYLGYPNTTGLPEIDYRVTDAVADPPGLTEALHTEKLARLPACFLCYAPDESAPPPGEAPAARGQGVTFGSFNNLAKVNDRLIDLWAEILVRLPAARLLLKSAPLADEGVREHLWMRFEAGGIERGRVRLLPRVASKAGHLGLYGDIDIALDTFPYNGTTTTCEALWMGVPVITLAGAVHASRVGASILSALGKTQWIAATREQYRDQAIALGSDLARMRGYRATLRDEMRGSALLDGRRIATQLEDLFHGWWEAR